MKKGRQINRGCIREINRGCIREKGVTKSSQLVLDTCLCRQPVKRSEQEQNVHPTQNKFEQQG